MLGEDATLATNQIVKEQTAGHNLPACPNTPPVSRTTAAGAGQWTEAGKARRESVPRTGCLASLWPWATLLPRSRAEARSVETQILPVRTTAVKRRPAKILRRLSGRARPLNRAPNCSEMELPKWRFPRAERHPPPRRPAARPGSPITRNPGPPCPGPDGRPSGGDGGTSPPRPGRPAWPTTARVRRRRSRCGCCPCRPRKA